MSQRSNCAKTIIKNSISIRRAELPKLKLALAKLSRRLATNPDDEQSQENEAKLKTRLALYVEEIGNLEELLESEDIHIIEKNKASTTIYICGSKYQFNRVPNTFFKLTSK